MSSTRNPHRRRRRLLFIFAAVLLITIGATAWILKTNEIISNLGALFTILGVVVAFAPEDPPLTHNTYASSAVPIIDKQSQANSYLGIEGITPEILGITKGRAAIIVYTDGQLVDSSIDLVFGFNRLGAKADIVEQVVRRRKNKRTVFVCIFQELPAGNYTVRSGKLRPEAQITINAGDVKEVNWRRRANNPTTQPSTEQT